MAQNWEQALQQLIQQLMGGGTDLQRQEIAGRHQEAQATRHLREQYSKEAAALDARAAVEAAISQAIQANQRNINRAAAGAGGSAGSMRALLSQELSTQAAELGALLAAQQKTDYGQIAAGLSNTLESMTRPQSGDNMVNQLVAALGTMQQASGPAGGAAGGGGQRGARSGAELRQNLGWAPLGSQQSNQFPPGMQNLGPAGTQQPAQAYQSHLLNVGGAQQAAANRDAAILQAWQQQGGLFNTPALQQILNQPAWEFGGVYNPGART